MEVFVDDQQIDSNFADDRTVEDALRYVQSSICGPGCIVVGLRCDGQSISANEMAPMLAKSISTLERIEVITGSRRSLVMEAMSQASAALNETEETCRRVADLLTEGSIADGIQMLGVCVGVWQQIHDAVGQSIQMLQVDPEQMMVENQPLSAFIGRPREALLQVKQALESQDHVLLADIMQYEFETVTQEWHAMIDGLRQEAERLATG